MPTQSQAVGNAALLPTLPDYQTEASRFLTFASSGFAAVNIGEQTSAAKEACAPARIINAYAGGQNWGLQ